MGLDYNMINLSLFFLGCPLLKFTFTAEYTINNQKDFENRYHLIQSILYACESVCVHLSPISLNVRAKSSQFSPLKFDKVLEPLKHNRDAFIDHPFLGFPYSIATCFCDILNAINSHHISWADLM